MNRLTSRLAVAAICFAGPVNASTATAGEITSVVVTGDNLAIFEQAGTRTSLPECAGEQATKRWAMPIASNAEATLFRQLLVAEAAQTPIAVIGSGSCADGLDVETVWEVKIIP